MHATDIGFCYLDFIAAGKTMTGQGLGGALYERVRDEALNMGASCILMECLPDDPGALARPENSVNKMHASRVLRALWCPCDNGYILWNANKTRRYRSSISGYRYAG